MIQTFGAKDQDLPTSGQQFSFKSPKEDLKNNKNFTIRDFGSKRPHTPTTAESRVVGTQRSVEPEHIALRQLDSSQLAPNLGGDITWECISRSLLELIGQSSRSRRTKTWSKIHKFPRCCSRIIGLGRKSKA